MHIRYEALLSPALRFTVCRLVRLQAAMVCLATLLALAGQANAQLLPAEYYGPYNAVFLPDGPGLTKSLAPPSPLDSRSAALLDRMGLRSEEHTSELQSLR